MQRIAPLAAGQGFTPKVVVCAGDLAAGRPAPLQMWHAMAAIGVWPASGVGKPDDTPPGIGEARVAGCWAGGVALTGNIAALDDASRDALLRPATEELMAAWAHLVMDSVPALPAAVWRIEARLVACEGPCLVEAS